MLSNVDKQCVSSEVYNLDVFLAGAERTMHCAVNYIINLINSKNANELIKGPELIELPLISWISSIPALWIHPY